MNIAVNDLNWRLRVFPLVGGITGLGLLALAAVLTGGSEPFGVSWPAVAVVYLAGGFMGGVIVALLFPLRRWLVGALLLGTLAAFPMYFGAGVALSHGHVRAVDWGSAAVASLFVGGLLGVYYTLNETRRTYKLARVWTFVGICTIVAWYMGLHWAGTWVASLAIFVFLVPIALALMVTLSASDGSAENDDSNR